MLLVNAGNRLAHAQIAQYNNERGDVDMSETIRQITAIPDTLTPMVLQKDDTGNPYYCDAIAHGWSVMYALLYDGLLEYVGFYVMDDEGAGGIHNDIVRLVPTMRCKSCGHRMIAETTTEKTDSVVYLCTCGEKFDGSIIKKLKGLTWK